MKNKIWLLGVLFSALCIAGGLLLPKAVFSYQNNAILSEVHKYSTDQAMLTYTSTLFETMELVSGDYYNLEYSQELASLTSDEAYNIGIEFLDSIDSNMFSPLGIQLHDSISTFSCDCQLAVKAPKDKYMASQYDAVSDVASDVADDSGVTYSEGDTTVNENSDDSTETKISNSENLTAIIWELILNYDNASYLRLIVDDNNKKVISFSFTSKKGIGNVSNKEVYFLAMDSLVPFFEEYYNVKLSEIYSDSYRYIFQLEDADGNIAKIPATISTDNISFGKN